MAKVTLNHFIANKRLQLLEQLKAGEAPSEGTYSTDLLAQARAKGKPPQMGSTRYEPRAVHLEFIYPDPQSSPLVLTITLTPPERIVYLPVPKWVVESIWQGEISGSPHFESDALAMLKEFEASLAPDENAQAFQGRAPVSREG